MSAVTEQVEALSKAVLSTDAGRRVGWAKVFAAEEKLSSASRDLNIMRAERDILYRYASTLHGVLHGIGCGPEVTDLIKGEHDSIGAVLDPRIVNSAALAAAEAMRATELRRASDAARKKMRNTANRQFKAGQEHERTRLARQFGFPNEAAMFNHLEATS